MPVEIIHSILKLLLKQRFLVVFHGFHWLLVAAKLLTAKLHSRNVKGSGICERSELESESDISLQVPQPLEES